ncbi:MAG: aminotransferase class I/II-fold pyridoxal phosphate-dependent enzyme [Acidimicrobiia bacterium]
MELIERIESDVASGVLGAGERLPSIRELAESLSLAPNTVATAYRRLADRGVVVSRGSAGTHVLERPPIGVQQLPIVPPGTTDLASGTPDPRLLPDLDSFVRHPGPSTSYIDPPLLPELAEAGSEWLGAQGVAVRRLTVTSGALDAIERILASRLRPGDAVAVERPGWSAVTDLVASLGLRSVGVAIDEAGMIPVVLAERLSGVEAVILTPRAQNPLGAAIDERRRQDLSEVLAERPEVLVIEDDHAGPIAGTPLYPLHEGRSRWAFVQSVAKALGPDLRLAFVTGDDLTLDRVSGRFGIGPGWVSRILQRAVASMVTDPEVKATLVRAAETYAIRREALVDALRLAGFSGATGRSGLNVWVPVAAEEAAVAGAARAGYGIRGGSEFDGGVPTVRITVSNLDLDAIPSLVRSLSSHGESGRRLV